MCKDQTEKCDPDMRLWSKAKIPRLIKCFYLGEKQDFKWKTAHLKKKMQYLQKSEAKELQAGLAVRMSFDVVPCGLLREDSLNTHRLRTGQVQRMYWARMHV